MNTYTDQQVSEKPGKVQAMAIMTLVSGILNIIWGITLAMMLLVGALGTWGLTLCVTPLSIYPIVVGIFEIISGSKLLRNPPLKTDIKTIAILEIPNIIFLSIPSLVVGILNLVFYNEPEVRNYITSLPKK